MRFSPAEPDPSVGRSTGRDRSTGRGSLLRIALKSERPGERGLPKVSVAEGRLTARGVEGDFNRYRHEEKHDDPGMAILLLPIETIEELNREGWPVRPGDLGENLLVRGLGPGTWRTGTRLRVGDSAVLELSKPCEPCSVLHSLPYVGPSRGAAFVRALLGRRGWYARVVREGLVRPHDAVEPAEERSA